MCQSIKKGEMNFNWTQTESWESFEWGCFRNNNFYQQDEYSRCCPGMKVFVSVTKDSVMRKHQECLPLLNIDQLFLDFKKAYLTVKIGLSKFCKLRPKWMKTANHGMDSVCLCQYHQKTSNYLYQLFQAILNIKIFLVKWFVILIWGSVYCIYALIVRAKQTWISF